MSMDLSTAQQVKAQNEQFLLATPGVHTVMTTIIGGQPAILVYSTIPVNLPPNIEGIPIVVQIQPMAEAMTVDLPWTKGIRPVPSGVHIYSGPGVGLAAMSGTLGLIVSRNNIKYLISAYHVLAIQSGNMFKQWPLGTPIWQPAPLSLKLVIGHLSGYVPIIPQAEGINLVDFAWAQVPDSSQVIDHIYGLTPLDYTATLEDHSVLPNIGDIVYKSGAYSGITFGTVSSLDTSAIITYRNTQTFLIVDFITVENMSGSPFVISGDSGSAVFTGDGFFVGLVCAKGSHTYVCKAKYIYDPVNGIGHGFSFRPHSSTIIDEPYPQCKIPVKITSVVLPEGAGTTDPPVGETMIEHDSNISEQIQIHFSPKEGYKYDHYETNLYGEGGSDPSPILPLKISDMIITSYYSPTTPEISCILTIAVSPEGAGIATPTAGVYSSIVGTTVNVVTVANTGYVFDHWIVTNPNGTTQDFYSESIEITLSGDTVLTAYFVSSQPDIYTVSARVTGQGSVLPPGGEYLDGEAASFTATPEPGYKFDHWADDLGNTYTDNPLSIVVNGNIILTAYFTKIPAPETAGVGFIVGPILVGTAIGVIAGVLKKRQGRR